MLLVRQRAVGDRVASLSTHCELQNARRPLGLHFLQHSGKRAGWALIPARAHVMRDKPRRTRVCYVICKHGGSGLRKAHPAFDSV